MIDFDEALEQTADVRDRRCYVTKLIEALPEGNRERAAAALAGDAITHAHLARTLTAVCGTKVDQNAIGKHRRGGCCNGL